MTTHHKDDFLVVVLISDFLHGLLVALFPLEIFFNDAVGYHLDLVAIAVDGA